jgi:hypothetical protein
MLTSLAMLPIQVKRAASKRASCSDHRPVLGRAIVKVVGEPEAARALHIGRDDPWITGNVLADVHREQPRIDIVSAARTRADIERDRLAAIELRRRARVGARRSIKRRDKRKDSPADTHDH